MFKMRFLQIQSSGDARCKLPEKLPDYLRLFFCSHNVNYCGHGLGRSNKERLDQSPLLFELRFIQIPLRRRTFKKLGVARCK